MQLAQQSPACGFNLADSPLSKMLYLKLSLRQCLTYGEVLSQQEVVKKTKEAEALKLSEGTSRLLIKTFGEWDFLPTREHMLQLQKENEFVCLFVCF